MWMVVDSDNMTVPFSADVASDTSTITVSVPSPGVYTVNCVATNGRGTNMSQATFNAIGMLMFGELSLPLKRRPTLAI